MTGYELPRDGATLTIGDRIDRAAPDQAAIHSAIDLLTAALIDLQRIRRHAALDGLDGDLQLVEDRLHYLGTTLTAIRDQTG